MRPWHRCLARLLTCSTSIALAACAHTTPEWDAHFGDATRIALAQQVLDPLAAQRTAPPLGMDGRAAAGAYQRYQKSSSEPAPAPASLLSVSSGGR
ncbi:MAG: hypothetical protein ACEQSK_05415 [Sphingomonadaceae bacterium]